ncbi:hypothetical protein [Streptomyces sp. NRRL WC-3742]|uniref:hypothetical protein n=1 Tax=Streptomyces sp. NRRL WC-3742 TaxID=1463934 RepID=UPI0004C8BE30|nr:hypothetical protein [Streptomyces sp. NRRL WC-3742]
MSANATTRSTSPSPAPTSAFSPWTVRGTLALDAVVTGGNGLAYLALSGPLGDLLGIGRSTLLGLGLFLTAYALLVAALATRPRPHRLAVLTVVDLNAAWTVLSLVALATRLEPTTAGAVWIPAQAAVVALFVALQLTALRRRDAD